MKVSEIFPRRFVSGEDLQGKAFLVTIDFVQKEDVATGPGAKPEPKWILYLAGSKKGIILSRTLAEQIVEIVKTDETNEWPAKQIVIYPVPMTVAGKQRVAIRARAPKPGSEAAELKHEDEEEQE